MGFRFDTDSITPDSGSGGGSGQIESLNVTPTTSAQTITAPSGVDGYNPINVSAVTANIDNNIVSNNIVSGVSILGVNGSATILNGETVNITPTTSQQIITPTSPKNGITQATVAAVTSSIDSNIIAENIKKDVPILGVVGTLESGGGGSVDHGGKYSVKVIDYDGSIISEDHLNTGDVFTLPSPPNKNPSLVFQEWSGTTTITNNTVTVGTEDILIGAVYDTVSGLSEFDIELDAETGLTIDINNLMDTGTLRNTAQVDWGDGIVETKPSNTTHTYQNYGKYTIKTNLRCDNSFESDYVTMAVYVTDNNSKYLYVDIIKAMRLSSNVFTNGVFNLYVHNIFAGLKKYITIPRGITKCSIEIDYNNNLTNIILPTTIESVSKVSIQYHRKFKYLIIPNTVFNAITDYKISTTHNVNTIKIPTTITTLTSDNYQFNYNVEKIFIHSNINTIPANTFRYNYELKYIYFLGNITLINKMAFGDSTELKVIDFTNCTEVPTLNNTNGFSSQLVNFYKYDCKILVPSNLLSSWKTATNWSTFADIIYGV